MDIENARRNLKDFLTMYNHFTESCFERCVKNLNYRILTPEEESCTDKCINKLVNVNHRQISKYMEINPLNRKLNELKTTTDPAELQNPPPDINQQVEDALQRASLTSDDSTAASADTGSVSIESDGVSNRVHGESITDTAAESTRT